MILSTSVWNTSTHKDIKLNVKDEFVPKHESKVDTDNVREPETRIARRVTSDIGQSNCW